MSVSEIANEMKKSRSKVSKFMKAKSYLEYAMVNKVSTLEHYKTCIKKCKRQSRFVQNYRFGIDPLIYSFYSFFIYSLLLVMLSFFNT